MRPSGMFETIVYESKSKNVKQTVYMTDRFKIKTLTDNHKQLVALIRLERTI